MGFKKIISTLLVAVLILAITALGAKPNNAADNGLTKGNSDVRHLYLFEKDPTNWEIIPGGAWGKMTFDQDRFVFNGHGLEADMSYTLMYYPDPWPGNGLMCLGTQIANNGGNVMIKGDEFGFETLPSDSKIWLVPTSIVDCDAQTMIGWQPTEILFEYDLI